MTTLGQMMRDSGGYLWAVTRAMPNGSIKVECPYASHRTPAVYDDGMVGYLPVFGKLSDAEQYAEQYGGHIITLTKDTTA